MRYFLEAKNVVRNAAMIVGACVLLSGQAGATPLLDGTFIPPWSTTTFQNVTGGLMTANIQPSGGSPTNYLDITESAAASGNIYSQIVGVDLYYITYDPGTSGAIISLAFQIQYNCGASGGTCQFAGQKAGFALKQGSKYFIANSTAWGSALPFTHTWNPKAITLTASDFDEVSVTASSIAIPSHPNFSAPGPIWFGFFTANSPAGNKQETGYDNFRVDIKSSDVPTGQLKICKIGGDGVPAGTDYGFTISTSTSSAVTHVPAGTGPGGNCVLGPSYPVPTVVGIGENTNGSTVTDITVAPPNRETTLHNDAQGTVGVTIGSGVTEVTYTNEKHTGYLEICKQGDVTGSYTFTVTPTGGPPQSVTVPAGACSSALAVTSGTVQIHENVPATVRIACSTIPAPAQGPCSALGHDSTVTVAAGDISQQTIAIITNLPLIYHGGDTKQQ